MIMGTHLIDGDFQSDKYPTCPLGKVPLSTKDPTAQDLLWEYAQRRRKVDQKFSDDLEVALTNRGYVHLPKTGMVPTSFRLPGGQLLSISEWLSADFRSAMVIIPRATDTSWRLFSDGRGEPLPGSTTPPDPVTRIGRCDLSTLAHTNVPRGGRSGLPQEWEMFVTHWRAQASVPLDDHLIEWASQTSCEFVYNCKSYGSQTLLDLLQATQSIGDPFPIWMREYVDYYVNIQSPADATEKIRRSRCGLDDRTRSVIREIEVALEMLKADGGSTSGPHLRHARDILTDERKVTIWIHLSGFIKRAIQ